MKNYIQVPLFNNEYKVVVAWGDHKYINKVLKRYKHAGNVYETWHDAKARGLTYYEHGRHPVIALPKFPKTPEEIGTLAHEACHAVERVLQYMQIPVEGEILAHGVGAVVRLTLE